MAELFATRVFAEAPCTMPVILTYHHIATPPASGENPSLFVAPEDFDRQLAWLRSRGFEGITLDRLDEAWTTGGPLPRRAVIITFDDGFENNFTAALPLLRRHGFPAVFFVTTGRIGGVDERGHRHMTEDQLREAASCGVTLGSHTATHPKLAKLDATQARSELTDSKSALETISGGPVRWLAYPSGSFSPSVARAAEEAGYAGACSVIRDNRVLPRQRYWMPRVMVMHDTTARRFAYYFSPMYHWVHAPKNRSRWKPYL